MFEKLFENSLWASRFIVLLAVFFQKVAHTQYNGALDMLYFAMSITAVAVGLFFLGKVGKH